MRVLTRRELPAGAQRVVIIKKSCGNAEAATKLKVKALALKHPSKVQEKVEKHLQNALEKQVQRSLKDTEKHIYSRAGSGYGFGSSGPVLNNGTGSFYQFSVESLVT